MDVTTVYHYHIHYLMKRTLIESFWIVWIIRKYNKELKKGESANNHHSKYWEYFSFLKKMGSILCVHLEESRIISLLVQKSESGIGYETHCERCIPLSSLCFLESGEQKFVFGFDTTHFADIIPNSCVLQSPEEFLQQPLLFAENNMSQLFSFL